MRVMKDKPISEGPPECIAFYPEEDTTVLGIRPTPEEWLFIDAKLEKKGVSEEEKKKFRKEFEFFSFIYGIKRQLSHLEDDPLVNLTPAERCERLQSVQDALKLLSDNWRLLSAAITRATRACADEMVPGMLEEELLGSRRDELYDKEECHELSDDDEMLAESLASLASRDRRISRYYSSSWLMLLSDSVREMRESVQILCHRPPDEEHLSAACAFVGMWTEALGLPIEPSRDAICHQVASIFMSIAGYGPGPYRYILKKAVEYRGGK
jgi:hypothetical protein